MLQACCGHLMAFTEREGVAGIALLAMYADGVIMQVEDDVLRERLLQYPLFAAWDDHGLSVVPTRLESEIRHKGADTVIVR